MREAPELGIESKDIAVKPEQQVEETVSGASGGIPQHEVNQRTLEDAREAAKLADAAKAGAVEGQLENETPETTLAKDDKMKALKNRIMGFFGQAPEQLSSKYSKLGEERMQKNPALRQAYENYLATESSEVAQSYKEAVGKWKYIARDKEGNFVDKTIYSVASGEVNKEG